SMDGIGRPLRAMAMAVATFSPDNMTGPTVERCCVHDGSVEEINRFKWIASEKAGYDMGEKAIRQWIKDHWNGYLRSCWLEHLLAKRFWIDLEHRDFGLLTQACPDEPLLDAIVEKLKNMDENLNIIDWALAEGLPMDRVKNVLLIIDINS